jgi:hypothetical protein
MNILRELQRLKYGVGACPQGKGGGSSAPAPDPAIGQAELEEANVEQQEEGYMENTYMPEQQAAENQANAIDAQEAGVYEQTAAQQNAQSAAYYNQYENTYAPLMNNMVSQAANYDSDGNFQQQAQLAIGDVNNTMNAQNQAQAMQMQSVGVDPTSGAYQSMWNANGINQAAQQAAAGTRARTAAQQLGWNMEDQAAAMGQSLPGDSAQASSVANQATGGASSTANSTVSNANQSQATTTNSQSSMGNLEQGIGQMGNAQYQTQVNAWNDQQQAQASSDAGIGSIVGAVGSVAVMV